MLYKLNPNLDSLCENAFCNVKVSQKAFNASKKLNKPHLVPETVLLRYRPPICY